MPFHLQRTATTPSRRAGLTVLGAVLLATILALAPIPPESVAAQTGSSITLSTTELRQGATLTIDYVTDEPHDRNWIGIYRQHDGIPDGNPGSRLWQYTPGPAGTAEFSTGPLAPGNYHAWFLARDGYAQLAGPVAFTVTNPRVPVDPVETDVSTDGVIYRQTFDDVPAGSTTAPEGWAVSFDDPMAGAADEWQGWTFTTRSAWTAGVDEMRNRFGRAQDVIAVADASQFGGSGTYSSTLTSEPIAVAGEGPLRLTFDSHYRGEARQHGRVRVSFDGGAPIELLRLDEQTVTPGYDGRHLNATQDVVVEVPAGAEAAVFSWELTGDADARWWAIDSVAVHRTLVPTTAAPTSAWVVSDIQGHPHDLAHGLEDLSVISPDADGLIMAGDIVDTGAQWEWDEIYAVMDAAQGIRPRQTIAAIGNHERYAPGGFAVNRDRFLTFAERDQVWGEYVLEGPSGDLPVITFGQDSADPPDVPMSEEQVAFVEERIAHWTELGKQVVLTTHYPLGDTVSASWIPWYHTHHQHNDRLTALLGNHPNVIILTGHTHYPAELGDWAVQRRTDGGHPDGFWAVNTLAMHVEWEARGENTQGITEVVTGDINRGLTLDSYGDRVVITAHDFAADEQLRQVTIPNPLVPFDAVAPEPELPAGWEAGRVYVAGDVVSHGGAVFEAQWWTTEQPGASPWGSWMEHGAPVACAAGEVAAWTASMVYVGGEQVAHAGQVLQARWWSRNQQPGDPWGPWDPVIDC